MSLREHIYSVTYAPGEAAKKVESHRPRIEAPRRVKKGEAFEVEISVGPHPNTPEHSIRWIDVYYVEEGRAFNPIHVARVQLEPGVAEPRVRLRLKLEKSGRIVVLAYCNLHGLWEDSVEVIVE